jgi:hypothetical protein
MRVWHDAAHGQRTDGEREGMKRDRQTIASAIARRIVMTLPERLTAPVSRVRPLLSSWTMPSILDRQASTPWKVPARSSAFMDSPSLKVPLVPPVRVMCQRGSLPAQSAHGDRQGHRDQELRAGEASERNQPEA